MQQLRVFAVIAAILALQLGFTSTETQAQAPLTIHLGGVPTDDLTPVIYAIRQGLYKKVGLDVQYVPTASGSIATTAAVTGAYEMGKGSPAATMVAHLKGLPLVVVASGAIWNPNVPFNELLVAADSTTKTGADLNGKTIGVPALNDLNMLVISAWVDQTGGDSRTLKFTEIPNSVAASALESHRIDADALQEPELTLALSGGGVKAIAKPYSAVSTNFVFGIYFANKDWATAHQQAVRDWVRVTYQAAAYTNTHHAETAALMSEFTKVPPAVFAKMARVDGATASDPSLLQPFINAAAKYKLISSAFPAEDVYFK